MFRHIETAAHEYATTKNTIDEALLYYAQQKQLQHLANEETSSIYADDKHMATNDCEDNDITSNFVKMYAYGWARRVRRVRRLTDKQKTFIETLFNQGAAAKTKLSAEQMAERMHMVDGKYYFHSDEYLETSQIRSLISRINKRIKSNPIIMSELDGIIENMDEICEYHLN